MRSTPLQGNNAISSPPGRQFSSAGRDIECLPDAARLRVLDPGRVYNWGAHLNARTFWGAHLNFLLFVWNCWRSLCRLRCRYV